jgi:hypothetical protein
MLHLSFSSLIFFRLPERADFALFIRDISFLLFTFFGDETDIHQLSRAKLTHIDTRPTAATANSFSLLITFSFSRS